MSLLQMAALARLLLLFVGIEPHSQQCEEYNHPE